MNPGALHKPMKKKEVAGGVRKKERRYIFDAAYDGDHSNEDVYAGTVLPHIAGVLRGTNATVGPGRYYSPCQMLLAMS